MDLAPIRPLAKLDGLCASIVAAFIAGSVRRSCRELLTGSLSILFRCRETPQQQANSNDDEAGIELATVSQGPGAFELVDLLDGRNLSPRAHNARALQAPRHTH